MITGGQKYDVELLFIVVLLFLYRGQQMFNGNHIETNTIHVAHEYVNHNAGIFGSII
jgi:hypothetical protein